MNARFLEWYFTVLYNSTKAIALQLFVFLSFDQVRMQKGENK